MYVSHLSLENYRNYAHLEIDLQARLNLVQGGNAQGKTNLLEALHYFSTTKSPRTTSDRELMRWTADEMPIPHTYMSANYVKRGEEHSIDVTMVKEPYNGGGAYRFRRRLELDGGERRAMDVVGELNTVLFLPEDIVLVAGSPGDRRRYLDVTLCQVDRRYCRSLSRYNKIMSQRNALLRDVRKGHAGSGELHYWDGEMARLGAYVLARRLWAVAELEPDADHFQQALTAGQESLRLEYDNSLGERLDDASESLFRQAQALESALRDDDSDLLTALRDTFLQCYDRLRSDEIRRGVTLAGPHRDDVHFLVNGVDATTYASRGQQRTIALATKLAEVRFMRKHVQEMPILLLDDVVSELDRQRSELLLDTVSVAEQVFITTTDLGNYPQDFLQRAVLWRVAKGTLSPLD